MSYFDKKASCGAPLWQVESFLFFFWLAGAFSAPLAFGASISVFDYRWLLTPVIIAVFLWSYWRWFALFFFGSFAGLLMGLGGLAELLTQLNALYPP